MREALIKGEEDVDVVSDRTLAQAAEQVNVPPPKNWLISRIVLYYLISTRTIYMISFICLFATRQFGCAEDIEGVAIGILLLNILNLGGSAFQLFYMKKSLLLEIFNAPSAQSFIRDLWRCVLIFLLL